MKVYIGPYKYWVGPYQIAKFFFEWEFKEKKYGEELADKVGEWLADTWVNTFCQWIESKRERNIKVRIDDYDAWGADHTMSYIIHPILLKLKENKHGAPWVDDEDVPAELRSTAAPPKENEWDTDENHFKRWDWVLDEMIFAFENIKNADWEDQFHKGEIDFKFEVVPGYENKPKEEQLMEMKKGPKDTHSFDSVGWKAYSDRIDNGCRLFGKYYRCLWD